MLVDDEDDILEFLSYNLKKEGYTVFTASIGKEAIAIAQKEFPNLVILDVMMPGMDGMEVCRELRKNEKLKDVLIAFLTARNEDYSQISGFESGADDYITKPIKPSVFISRVKALLRRASKISSSYEEIGGIKIDREKYIVGKGGKDFSLPKKNLNCLHFLLQSRAEFSAGKKSWKRFGVTMWWWATAPLMFTSASSEKN